MKINLDKMSDKTLAALAMCKIYRTFEEGCEQCQYNIGMEGYPLCVHPNATLHYYCMNTTSEDVLLQLHERFAQSKSVTIEAAASGK